MQNHRVGDVGDMKFVKTNQLETLGHAQAQFIQWVDRALKFMEFSVYLTHELMKVQSGFALNRNRLVKAVHQETFTAPYPAVKINPLRNCGVVDQFFDGVGSFELVMRPSLRTNIERGNRLQLRRVTLKTSRFKFLLVNL